MKKVEAVASTKNIQGREILSANNENREACEENKEHFVGYCIDSGETRSIIGETQFKDYKNTIT